MAVHIKRVYEPPAPEDGARVLVDRLWPRGISKAAAHLDLWLKDIAPPDELRRWFGHDPARWEEFRERYRQALDEPDPKQQEALAALLRLARAGTLTLLYAARDAEHNNAVVLREALEEREREEGA